ILTDALMKVSRTLLVLITSLLPLLYVNFIWQQLPGRVPIHFDLHGNVDGYTSIAGFYGFLFAMVTLSIGLFFLIKNGQQYTFTNKSYTQGTLEQIGLGTSLFITAINFILIQVAINRKGGLVEYILVLIPMLFIFIGNYSIRLKPNFFVGIRTASTLSNADNWRKTHLVAGRLMVVLGLLSIVPMMYVNFTGKLIIILILTGIITIYPIIYSYQLSSKK
ncbi:MAG: SdpI family protein, partial [Siphonobacter sp.]